MLKENFENGLGEWLVDVNVPLDPNNPGQAVEWNITRTTDIAYSGLYAIKMFIDGQQDDGTLWLERRITVSKNTQVTVTLSFWLYSGAESYNTIAGRCGLLWKP